MTSIAQAKNLHCTQKDDDTNHKADDKVRQRRTGPRDQKTCQHHTHVGKHVSAGEDPAGLHMEATVAMLGDQRHPTCVGEKGQ